MTTPPKGSIGGSSGAPPRGSLFGPAPTADVGEVIRQAMEDATALVKAEAELARAEITKGAKAKAQGAGLLAAAAALSAVASLGLLLTIGFVLVEVAGLPGWASALIISVVLLLIAGVVVVAGKKRFATPVTIDTTKANVQEDIAWIKQRLTSR